jgi:glycosyltransferase involved in cell wall biosynthesis
MRIAYFTETFLPKIDGIVTRLARTLEQLRELGHEALVFSPQRELDAYCGHKVVYVPSIPFKPWYPELFLGLPRPRLGRELDRFSPDIVHVVNPMILGLWGTAIAKQRNLPLLASYHTDIPQYAVHMKLPFLSPLSKTFLRDVHNQAHLNLCTSQPMVDSAVGLGIKRVRLWPKAVDTERYHPRNRSEAMRRRLTDGHPERPLMICVGRLSHEKRLDWLYAPITQIEGVRLAFVGSGPAEGHLRERFARTPTVFTGYMSGQELAEAYASADVFAFPSDTETLGFVAMEAMASGVPVVGARAGGIPDIIHEGETGTMFTPGNLKELTEKLRELLFDEAKRRAFGVAARREMERYSWRASTEKLVEYYELAQTIHRRYDPPSRY